MAMHWSALLAGVTMWGIRKGMSQGLLAAMVADNAPADLRGTAYGFFNLVAGAAMLLSSALAGLLWELYGATTTFWAGAGLSLAALAALFAKRTPAA